MGNILSRAARLEGSSRLGFSKRRGRAVRATSSVRGLAVLGRKGAADAGAAARIRGRAHASVAVGALANHRAPQPPQPPDRCGRLPTEMPIDATG